MDSRRSESFETVARLRDSISRGDWRSAAAASAGLRRRDLPDSRESIGEYLAELRQTLVLARMARADLKASLLRVGAAARFQTAEKSPIRQDSAVSAIF